MNFDDYQEFYCSKYESKSLDFLVFNSFILDYVYIFDLAVKRN